MDKSVKKFLYVLKLLVNKVLDLQSIFKTIIKNQSRPYSLYSNQEELEELKILSAKLIIEKTIEKGILEDISIAEFKVFSQFGDDGIIQYLIHQVSINSEEEVFIELGASDYRESNTRFLMMNNNWRGLAVDSSDTNIRKLIKSSFYWRYDLTAASVFITSENIDSILSQHNFIDPIGLLSIDIDGNDYWIWKSITNIHPIIVVIEYNSIFGPDHTVVVPYDQNFSRSKAHFSNLYWGASLAALTHLAQTKGYSLVGCNTAGNNAFFVRNDRLGKIPPRDTRQAYVESKFRESRTRNDKLSFLSSSQRLEAICDLSIYSIDKDSIEAINSLFKLHQNK